MTLVVDSSVAVKWLVDEDEADLARPFLDLRPCAPDLIVAETTNVLWKKVRKGEIDADQAARGVRLLSALDLPLWSGARLSENALALSLRLDHAAYDCFFLALAQHLGAPLLTADAKFARKVAATGEAVDVVVLSEASALLEKR